VHQTDLRHLGGQYSGRAGLQNILHSLNVTSVGGQRTVLDLYKVIRDAVP
jgi:hypothetical protein